MIIQAVDQFDLNEMQTDLLTIGCYVFHDTDLENICPNVTWTERHPGYCIGDSPGTLDLLRDRISHYTKDFYKLEWMFGAIGSGVDFYADQWHDDAREKIDIQFLCYQTTLLPEEGGALEMQCFDGITRQYFPRIGDVAVMNHRNLLVHRVGPLYTKRRRIVCSSAYKYCYD